MSLLPQSKKSAEEIAKLRESIGIPALSEGEPQTRSAEDFASPAPVRHERAAEHLYEAPAASPQVAKPVHSLRRFEPILHSSPAKPSAESRIPFRRHSAEEIAEIRRREALAMLTPRPQNPKLAAAHIAILLPGYICAIAGAGWYVSSKFPIAAAAATAAIALLISAFVFARRPLSRHHAAFISVITLFSLVSGTLHYFPQLQHAT